ncbi:DUF2785 domain-containing protein [Undibacterium fentianense]|uniref:DUF2785 domain-containing protein n=1 Tax=Undibacterium fentianense TaxID=2828728 RepID=A0A941IGI7_9BURK|nr:DUF2785 domain-containing protein [Undibacterium fentianense]MBR7800040.1 DUF2785 domain-containing protein [Undibacterium fentianense]
MKKINFSAILLSLSCILSCVSAASIAACPPQQYTRVQLLELKKNNWQITNANERQHIALALLDCLGEPDPHLRDEIAFEALSFWMRNELIATETIVAMQEKLQQQINQVIDQNDPGFMQAFSAMVLAEIARVDRRKPFMSETQRQAMLAVAGNYLNQLHDYRGFDENVGWRHGVAHAADWMMQLSLNPALSKTQHQFILNTLAKHIANDQHFYIYGEGERLMTPVFYLALRSQLGVEEWERWFSYLFETKLDLKKTTQASLARKHNLTAFLSALYIALQQSQQDALRERLLPIVIKSLKKLN